MHKHPKSSIARAHSLKQIKNHKQITIKQPKSNIYKQQPQTQRKLNYTKLKRTTKTYTTILKPTNKFQSSNTKTNKTKHKH